MSVYICKVCGHIEFGQAPEKCPVCAASRASFNQNDNVFAESKEKSEEAAVKHVPFIRVNKECSLVPDMGCVDALVRIGEKVHPMQEAHFIQFIDCYVDNTYVARTLCTPGVYAAAVFHLKATGAKVRIVQNCNLHGYWTAEADL